MVFLLDKRIQEFLQLMVIDEVFHESIRNTIVGKITVGQLVDLMAEKLGSRWQEMH
jgi:hypothetical protein